MTAGFGWVALPTQCGSSGVMSFIVHHEGKIYQKDLSSKTIEVTATIQV